MTRPRTTKTDSTAGPAPKRAEPGLVVVFTRGEPASMIIPLVDGELLVERSLLAARGADDARMSRQHVEVSFGGSGWRFRDLGSRNGSFVDGARLGADPVSVAAPRVLRAGDTLFLPCAELNDYGAPEIEDGLVVGPSLRRVLDHVGRVAMTGDVLHLHGETGVGKDVAARIFHKSGRRAKGPFVPVNCAAIPASIAERLFFGVRRGAYTGADEDADGFVQSADSGTLFLDEIADLDLAVQAKLLRTLESGEVVPLGGAKPRRVDLAAVSATTVHLETRVAERAFRQDLFFRIARPAIHVPPLRERAEEIPWLASRIASELGRQLHVSFVEAALCRAWPGNVRELLAEVRAATQSAGDEGSPSVRAVHLAPSAGALFEKTAAATRTTEADEERRRQHAEIVEALRREGGNVAATARRLGLHRTQLRRLMARHEIDPHAYGR